MIIATKKLLTTPLSNDGVSDLIPNMVSDIQGIHLLLERIRSSPFFSLELDKSTDITNSALLVFAHFCGDSNLNKDMLFLKSN